MENPIKPVSIIKLVVALIAMIIISVASILMTYKNVQPVFNYDLFFGIKLALAIYLFTLFIQPLISFTGIVFCGFEPYAAFKNKCIYWLIILCIEFYNYAMSNNINFASACLVQLINHFSVYNLVLCCYIITAVFVLPYCLFISAIFVSNAITSFENNCLYNKLTLIYTRSHRAKVYLVESLYRNRWYKVIKNYSLSHVQNTLLLERIK